MQQILSAVQNRQPSMPQSLWDRCGKQHSKPDDDGKYQKASRIQYHTEILDSLVQAISWPWPPGSNKQSQTPAWQLAFSILWPFVLELLRHFSSHAYLVVCQPTIISDTMLYPIDCFFIYWVKWLIFCRYDGRECSGHPLVRLLCSKHAWATVSLSASHTIPPGEGAFHKLLSSSCPSVACENFFCKKQSSSFARQLDLLTILSLLETRNIIIVKQKAPTAQEIKQGVYCTCSMSLQYLATKGKELCDTLDNTNR